MKLTATISRYLLGAIFTFFGFFGLQWFMPPPQPPPGLAGDFQRVFAASHYGMCVSAFQFLSGVLLLINRFVPLALTILAAIIVNILMFHALMDLKGIVPGLIVVALWCLAFFWYRASFRPLLQSRVTPNND